jgi:hypothetical protein
VQGERDLPRPLGELLARRLHAAHDELEMRVVVALVLADHQELALAVGRAVQAVRAVEHEDLEARHAELLDQLGDLLDVRAVHRREVEAVVDVEAALGGLQHLGVELLVRPALVQVVLAGAEIVQARRDPAHGGGLALRDRVLEQRRVDAAVHVGVDHAGKGQAVLAVVHLLRASRRRCPAPPARTGRP